MSIIRAKSLTARELSFLRLTLSTPLPARKVPDYQQVHGKLLGMLPGQLAEVYGAKVECVLMGFVIGDELHSDMGSAVRAVIDEARAGYAPHPEDYSGVSG